jgi:hypothetical protein
MPLLSRPTAPRLGPPALLALALALAAALVITASACSGGQRSSTTALPARAAGTTMAGLPTAGPVAADPQNLPAAPNTTVVGGAAVPSGLGGAVAPAQAQVVRNANVVVDVSRGKVPASYDAVANLATANGGFVADSNLSTTQGSAPSARLTLRIPVDHLLSVLAALGNLGKVAQQDQQGTDVTGQLVDLGARIKTLQAEEDATRTLLGRAQAIGDILQIQNQLFNLRTQIEQLNGQQSQLNDKATYATIAIQVLEAGPASGPTPPPKPRPTLVRAWSLAGHNIVAVLDGAALAVGWVAPVLVVALLALPALLWWRRRIGPGPATSKP